MNTTVYANLKLENCTSKRARVAHLSKTLTLQQYLGQNY